MFPMDLVCYCSDCLSWNVTFAENNGDSPAQWILLKEKCQTLHDNVMSQIFANWLVVVGLVVNV